MWQTGRKVYLELNTFPSPFVSTGRGVVIYVDKKHFADVRISCINWAA